MTSSSNPRRFWLLTIGVLGASGLLLALRWPQVLPSRANQTAQTPANKTADDGTQRQTARAWTGSPLGPNNAFEDPNREATLRLAEVFDAMPIRKGASVADIGAGGGWLSVRLARRVGDSGTVYAEEILKEYTDYIESRAVRENLKNIKTVLGTTSDPKLPPNALDAAIILNAYHEFDRPLVMLRKIYNSLKPGGRLGFIERDSDELRQEAREAYAKTGKIKRRVAESRDGDPCTDDHRLAREIIEREAAQIGFKKVSILQLREFHYLLVVEKPQK